MEPFYIIITALGILLIGAIGILVYFFAQGSEDGTYSQLSGTGRYAGNAEEEEDDDALLEELQQARAQQIKDAQGSKKGAPTVAEQLVMAGLYSEQDRLDFQQKRVLAPVVLGVVGLIVGMFSADSSMLFLAPVIGVGMGLYIPLKMLSGWVQQQHDEISFYLPLVIEQISIGVSSSLDIGPCLSQIVQMADERRNHNAVTELLKYAHFQVKSGVGLEEALNEVGSTSGQPELKHALLALSQVAKFGGEISRQLQDLADAVANTREAKIETKIRLLELKATGPVALVFVGYIIILGAGIASNFTKLV